MEENIKRDAEEKHIAATLIDFSTSINDKIDNNKPQDSDITGIHLMLNAVNNLPSSTNNISFSNVFLHKNKDEISSLHPNSHNVSPRSIITMKEYIELFNIALDKIDETGSLKRDYNKSIAQNDCTYTSPLIVEFLIDKLNISSSDILYEFDSGIGNVLIHIACRTVCKCFGSEMKEYEYNISNKLYTFIENELLNNKKLIGKISIHRGDPLDQISTLKNANIILMLGNSTQNDNKNYMENVFLNTLNHGTKVVTTKELFPPIKSKNARYSNSFASLFNFNYELIQDELTKAQFFVYTVDRKSRNKRSNMNLENFEKNRKPKVNIQSNNECISPLGNYIKDIKTSEKIEEFVALQNLNSNMLSLILLSFNYESNLVDNIYDDECSKIGDIVPLYSVEKRKKYPEMINYTLCDREKSSNFNGSKLGYKINIFKKKKKEC